MTIRGPTHYFHTTKIIVVRITMVIQRITMVNQSGENAASFSLYSKLGYLGDYLEV